MSRTQILYSKKLTQKARKVKICEKGLNVWNSYFSCHQLRVVVPTTSDNTVPLSHKTPNFQIYTISLLLWVVLLTAVLCIQLTTH